MVLGKQLRVALLAEADDAVWIGIVALDADNDRLRSGQDAHAGWTARVGAFIRLDLREPVGDLRGLPRRLVEHAVDREACDERAGAQLRRALRLRAGRPRLFQRRQQDEGAYRLQRDAGVEVGFAVSDSAALNAVASFSAGPVPQ